VGLRSPGVQISWQIERPTKIMKREGKRENPKDRDFGDKQLEQERGKPCEIWLQG